MRVVVRTLALSAMAALLLASAGAASADAELDKGKQVYATFCATCHGPEGDGQGMVGKTLQPPPRDFTTGDFKYGGSDKEIFDLISNGAASKGGSPLMAPWGGVIPEADRHALVKVINSFIKK
ncbi:MAG: cytochrome c [bacterium]|nr:cytochrome c [bacterium]